MIQRTYLKVGDTDHKKVTVMLGSKMESIIRIRVVSYKRDVECELEHTYIMTGKNLQWRILS